jgi:adenylate cyclase
MVEPMVLYFMRKAMARALREDFAVHVAMENGKVSLGEVHGRLKRTIGFIDLSDFTPMTATKSDLEAVAVLRRFADFVRGHVMTAGGSVVKQIGDEFMLAFHDSATAVACLSAIHREAQAEPQFPAVRTGLHVGEMLYRDGDYVGTVVNTAARIRGVAGRHQIMVSGDVRREAGRVGGVSFVRVGRRALKGLPTDLEVFEVTYANGDAEARVVDPVCGVELAAAEVAARLTLDGVEREFCSDDCLRKFVVEPATYSGDRTA